MKAKMKEVCLKTGKRANKGSKKTSHYFLIKERWNSVKSDGEKEIKEEMQITKPLSLFSLSFPLLSWKKININSAKYHYLITAISLFFQNLINIWRPFWGREEDAKILSKKRETSNDLFRSKHTH